MTGKKPEFVNMLAGFALLLSCTVTKTKSPVETKPVKATTVQSEEKPVNKSLLEELMAAHPADFDSVLRHRSDWNVQILYTQVNHGANGSISLQNHSFNTDPGRYFYPASTVKLPIVLLALQKLNELRSKGIDINTTMITEAGYPGQTVVYNDPTSPDGRPCIAQYIKKILLVSDNDAFNRLYEFLGQAYINNELQQKGYSSSQIMHRLNIFLNDEANRNTNPVRFLDSNSRLIYEQPAQRSGFKFASRNDTLGKGYYSGGKLISKAMNFSGKNRISLQDLHSILISLIYPMQVPARQRFNISESDRNFVLQYMSQLPTETLSPPYADDTASYWPAYGKFLLMGAGKGPWPNGIRIFNKIGGAYGHMIDVAYVADFGKKIEFFLSAVIYCNSDGVLNDDKYDYDNIGLPFMKHLGQLIYDYELKRTRKVKPDLSSFIFKYDK